MMFVFGLAAFAVVAPMQLRVMNAAGHAPDVASAANISAFTLGSAIGITLGGAAIDNGLGLAAVNWVGGTMTTAGLLVTVATWVLLDRRAPRHTPPNADHAHHESTGEPVQHAHADHTGAHPHSPTPTDHHHDHALSTSGTGDHHGRTLS